MRSRLTALALALSACQAAVEPRGETEPLAARVGDVGAPADALAPARHRLLRLQWSEAGGLRILGAVEVPGALPRPRGDRPAGAWRYRALAADGRALHAGELDDPRLVRAEFHGQDDIDGRVVRRPGPAHFTVRLPLDAADRLELTEGSPPSGPLARAAAPFASVSLAGLAR